MNKYTYIAFFKPFGVLCQFTTDDNTPTLADFDLPKKVYPVGRLDKDSEGLLLLTNDGQFNQMIANPKGKKVKTYWVQVENIPDQNKLNKLARGVIIKNYKTKPCEVKLIDPQNVQPRDPPIRERKNIPTCWLEIKITEGKNRQVRRMTAAIGHPTLRLIRTGINKLHLNNFKLKPGQWTTIQKTEVNP